MSHADPLGGWKRNGSCLCTDEELVLVGGAEAKYLIDAGVEESDIPAIRLACARVLEARKRGHIRTEREALMNLTHHNPLLADAFPEHPRPRVQKIRWGRRGPGVSAADYLIRNVGGAWARQNLGMMREFPNDPRRLKRDSSGRVIDTFKCEKMPWD